MSGLVIPVWALVPLGAGTALLLLLAATVGVFYAAFFVWAYGIKARVWIGVEFLQEFFDYQSRKARAEQVDRLFSQTQRIGPKRCFECGQPKAERTPGEGEK